MVLMLCAAAAAGLLLRAFTNVRNNDPQRAHNMSSGIQAAATIIGAVAAAVSMLLNALWGKPAEALRSSSSQTLRLGVEAG